jgi:FkbM family methyltransferase
MKIIEFIKIVRKCLGEARWSRYQKFGEKLEVFKILVRLRFYSEISSEKMEVATQKIFGFTVSAPNFSELLYLFREIFLDLQYEFKSETSAPKIIDGGTNVGMAILFFKMRYPNCEIKAFEPNPTTFKFLKLNVEQNNLQGVEIINKGLAGDEGIINFYVDNANSLISSMDGQRGGSEPTKITVTKLSKVLEQSQFDFAKIDIEGAECDVVTDLVDSNTIGNINQYIFEYHHNMKGIEPNLSGFLQKFEKNGFGYNLRGSFQAQGEFQDLAIHFYKR